jgi:uncharacterized protein YjdB
MGAVLVLLIGCGLHVSCGGGGMSPENQPKLKQIMIAPAGPTIAKGATVQLTATGMFDDGIERALATPPTWQTSESSLATVDAQGNVIGVAEGVAKISAAYQGITGSTLVTVGSPAVVSITIAPNQASLPLGESQQLTATGNFSDGSTQDLTQSATWSSSASPVAAVTSQGNVTGVGLGSAQVSATFQGITGSASVSVGAPVLLAIMVSAGQLSLPLGESEQFIATGSYSDGSAQDLTQSAMWSSSASTIAGVSAGGSVAAKATGAATISATAGAITGAANVTVAAAVVTSLSITPATLSVVLQGSRQLQATATFSDGTTKNMTTTVTWSSMQPNIALVNSSGMVTATQVGMTTILAQTNNVTGSADLTVVPLALVNYFNHASAVSSGIDGTVQIANPGPADLCAMVYVFDQDQELNECCGCTISDSGLRTLSVVTDLTANPLTGVKPRIGEIKIVPSDPTQNPQCNPANLAPTGALAGWGTNAQVVGEPAGEVTETPFLPMALNTTEQSFLTNMCTYLQKLGSGKGICSCGTGD